ncbi:MAG: heme o synthase [Thermoplasmata archaeon]
MSTPPAARAPGWRDYVDLTKPWITLLIVAVAVAGYFVALPGRIDPERLLVLVLCGAAASGGAATLNHYFDRDIDARMRRTRGRPLPTERIASEGRVLAMGLVLTVVGIGAAAVFLNLLTAFSILLGSLTYVLVYTVWLKRRTAWNIVIGGFAGSAPALAGSAAAVGHWTDGALALALLVFLWTPPHFWSLALMLREDYRAVGLPMLPRMDDPGYSAKVTVISCALLVPATVLLAVVGPIALPAIVALLAVSLLFLVSELPLWRRSDRTTALRGFIVSGPYLLAVIVVVILNWVLVRGVPGVGG